MQMGTLDFTNSIGTLHCLRGQAVSTLVVQVTRSTISSVCTIAKFVLKEISLVSAVLSV
jgi:hypothetical protein